MATAGYNSKMYASGASTAFTNEPCTLVSGKTYQINTAAKRVLDPAVVPVVKDNGVTVAAANIASFDPYFGLVTFATGYTVTTPVTFSSASYLPLLAIANLRELSASLKSDVLDLSVMGTANKKKDYGLADCSGDFTGLDPLVTDLDVGTGGRQSWWDFFLNRTPKLLQYDFDGGGTYVLRTWAVWPGMEVKSSVAAVVNDKVMWEQAQQKAFDTWGVPVAEFSFGAP